MHMYMHMCVYIYIYVYTHVCTYTYIYICIYICSYIYIFSVFTVGPITQSPEKLKGLYEAGMRCARMNFSHGTHEVFLMQHVFARCLLIKKYEAPVSMCVSSNVYYCGCMNFCSYVCTYPHFQKCMHIIACDMVAL